MEICASDEYGKPIMIIISREITVISMKSNALVGGGRVPRDMTHDVSTYQNHVIMALVTCVTRHFSPPFYFAPDSIKESTR